MDPAAGGLTAPARRPARLGVGVVGAGRVGAVLAAALAAAGHHVVAVSGSSRTTSERVGTLLPGVPVVSAYDVFERAELVLLTVPDDVLAGLVTGSAAAGVVQAGQLLVHTSGRFGVSVLDPATRLGALPLALHPVMTFSGTITDLSRLSGAVFGVSAPQPLRPVAEALVLEMGGEPVWVAEQDRPLYHAALAHAANHLVTLVASAADLLRLAGVGDPGRMLAPLLSAALEGALRSGDLALTGPVSRGDAGTVATHLDQIGRVYPAGRAAYLALARLSADRALAAGLLDPARAEALLEVLADHETGGPR